MAIETFPWDEIRNPISIKVRDKASVVRTKFEGGYEHTRARNTSIPKQFELFWNAMEASDWMALLKFFRARHGGAEAFYWQFPIGIYGEPTDISEAGFESEIEVGFGEGPIFLVQFVNDELEQEYLNADRWRMTVVLEEIF